MGRPRKYHTPAELAEADRRGKAKRKAVVDADPALKEKAREAAKRWAKNYRQSPKGRSWLKRYLAVGARLYARHYRASERGRAVRLACRKRYERTLAYKLSRERARRVRRTRPNGRFWEYCVNAKQRGHVFALTQAQFSTFWQKPCSYCGGPIQTIGLDRVDSALGYTLVNVVSCCVICNRMKSSLPLDVFLAYCRKIAAFAGPK